MKLSDTIKIQVPFYDVDSIQMVWHGHFLKYLEQGRESFGEKYGLEYMFIYNNGFLAPIADMHLSYKNSARFGDVLLVETSFRPSRGAKLIFDYKVVRENDGTLILEATTIQLFVTHDGVFEVSVPDFYAMWKINHEISD